MRNPPPRMDIPPDAALEALLAEALRAEGTLEKLISLYGVIKPMLINAYEGYLSTANPVADFPSRRIIRHVLLEEEEMLEWGKAALTALATRPEETGQAEAWQQHLQVYLKAAGGIDGDEEREVELPPSRAVGDYQPDYVPRRDTLFALRESYLFPPHDVVFVEDAPTDEVTLALMCKRALEMDVPECMAPMILEAPPQPWEFYVEMGRQLWDECRHAMFGEVYFERHDVDSRNKIALNPQFSIILNQYMSPVEAHAVLYTIEQGLMKGSFGGKRSEWECAVQADDRLASLFQDYDWADEVLHVQIGRRWGLPLSGMSRAEYIELGQDAYRRAYSRFEEDYATTEPRTNWWPTFAREILGRDSVLGESRTEPPLAREDSHWSRKTSG
jgi:hypothetical protein